MTKSMCVNCKHAGNRFRSAYSGKTMILCKLTDTSRPDYQSCDKFIHYKEKEE